MKRLKIVVITILSAAVILGAALFIWIETSISPIAVAIAEARVMSVATKSLNEAIAQALADVRYEELIHISYDESGGIRAIQADAAQMNRLATQTALVAQGKIAEITSQKLNIPLGSALGLQLFSNRGPSISVYAVPAGAVTSQFLSEFSSAGINQTHHRLFIKLTATMSVILPSHSSTVYATTQVPVAETVIIGAVPDYYMNVPEDSFMMNLVP